MLHEVVGGQINVASFVDEVPGAGTHTYKIQVRNSTGLYSNGKINRRALVALRAKR